MNQFEKGYQQAISDVFDAINKGRYFAYSASEGKTEVIMQIKIMLENRKGKLMVNQE